MRAADEVWLAVPATRRGRDRDPRVHCLCRLLGFGLMAVSATRDRVEVLVEPGPYQPRRDHRRRRQLLSEHARRRGDPSPGGGSRQPVMTAYRQQALACAVLLSAGPGSPRDLRTVAPDAGRILLRNAYGWFERTQRGVYQLTADGEAALCGGGRTRALSIPRMRWHFLTRWRSRKARSASLNVRQIMRHAMHCTRHPGQVEHNISWPNGAAGVSVG
jgi:hypothetical protein